MVVLKRRSWLVDTSDSETAYRLCVRNFVDKPLSWCLMKLDWLGDIAERVLSALLNEAAWFDLEDLEVEPRDAGPFTEVRGLD